jgi:hypothetical protein
MGGGGQEEIKVGLRSPATKALVDPLKGRQQVRWIRFSDRDSGMNKDLEMDGALIGHKGTQRRRRQCPARYGTAIFYRELRRKQSRVCFGDFQLQGRASEAFATAFLCACCLLCPTSLLPSGPLSYAPVSQTPVSGGFRADFQLLPR